ncbi:MAG: SLBB domain-containing protein [Deltaproteobacteria bacterium]|nr:SLBB domain-containing protein [Deltaproteobacteria bacterium]
MKTVSRVFRVFRNVPVFIMLAVAGPLFAQAPPAQPPFRNESPAAMPVLPPGVTPQQVEIWKQMLQSGRELPADAKKALEASPELRERLAAEIRKKLEGQEAEGEAARKPAPSAPPEAPAFPPGYDWKTSTYVGGLFAKRLLDNEAKTLIHFGHEVFDPRPGVAPLPENMPATPDYVIGPGDEVIVRLWGRMEGTHRMTVDREGKIFFPKLGSLYVAGKTFGELKSFLKSRISSMAEVSSDVSLGQMKGVRVSVVGEVRVPGWYSVGSMQTSLQALSLAGGVKDIGSLRRIKINRGGKEAGEIDLYDLLLRGDTRSDIPLLQGDAVFVPVVGRLVAVTGEVRRPAIYELRQEKTLLDLVAMSGGFSPSAYKRRVQVERLEGHTSKIVLDTDAELLEKEQRNFELADGDILRVLPIAGPEQNVVTLEGNVLRPGKYELKPGMTVGNLFRDEKDFLPDTYFNYALLTRLVPPDMHKEVLSVNLREIVLEKKEGADLVLQPSDTLKIFPRRAFRDAPKATVSGEVRMIRSVLQARFRAERAALLDNTALDNTILLDNVVLSVPQSDNAVRALFRAEAAAPDGKIVVGGQGDNTALTFEIFAGARAADLVKMAGGLTRLASLERAEIVRVDENRNYKTIYFHLGKALEGDPAENVPLESEDHLRVHSLLETKYRKTVTASGEVNRPGDYVLTEGMRLADLLFKAGGFKESAYGREAEIVRRSIAPGGELVKTQTLVVSPERALSGDANFDVPLQEYDLLVVRQIPDWSVKIQVTLAGEVRFPGVYTLRKGERLSSLLTRAGGFTPDAYLKAAQFTRASTQKTQQEAIDKLISDLELEVAQKAQAAGGALDKEDVEANRELMNARRALIEQLRKAKAKGRVVIRLAETEQLKGTSADILLEDGDRLDVPKKANVVNVVGRVYNPTGVVYDPANDRLGYYLRTVGGPTESADQDHIFMIKADGSVVTRDNVDSGFSVFSGGLMSARVEPGDSIVVPEKLIQTRVMKDAKDITQILFQIAVTTGVLIALF